MFATAPVRSFLRTVPYPITTTSFRLAAEVSRCTKKRMIICNIYFLIFVTNRLLVSTSTIFASILKLPSASVVAAICGLDFNFTVTPVRANCLHLIFYQ
jgi:hypothetical protein